MTVFSCGIGKAEAIRPANRLCFPPIQESRFVIPSASEESPTTILIFWFFSNSIIIHSGYSNN